MPAPLSTVSPPVDPTLVGIPYLNRDALDLLSNCCTSKESDLWFSLGTNWTQTIDLNLLKASRLPSSFQPIFSDGWAPVINELELIGLPSSFINGSGSGSSSRATIGEQMPPASVAPSNSSQSALPLSSSSASYGDVDPSIDHYARRSSNNHYRDPSEGRRLVQSRKQQHMSPPLDFDLNTPLDHHQQQPVSRGRPHVAGAPVGRVRRGSDYHATSTGYNGNHYHSQAALNAVPGRHLRSSSGLDDTNHMGNNTHSNSTSDDYTELLHDPANDLQHPAMLHQTQPPMKNGRVHHVNGKDKNMLMMMQQNHQRHYRSSEHIVGSSYPQQQQQQQQQQVVSSQNHRHMLMAAPQARHHRAADLGGYGGVGMVGATSRGQYINDNSNQLYDGDNLYASERDAQLLVDLGPAQTEWFYELQARDALIVRVLFSRDANNDKELTVRRGELLEVLDDSRKWWKTRNIDLQVAYVPHTIVAVMDQYQTLDELLLLSNGSPSSDNVGLGGDPRQSQLLRSSMHPDESTMMMMTNIMDQPRQHRNNHHPHNRRTDLMDNHAMMERGAPMMKQQAAATTLDDSRRNGTRQTTNGAFRYF